MSETTTTIVDDTPTVNSSTVTNISDITSGTVTNYDDNAIVTGINRSKVPVTLIESGGFDTVTVLPNSSFRLQGKFLGDQHPPGFVFKNYFSKKDGISLPLHAGETMKAFKLRALTKTKG